jgi:transcriptional regulator with XRE-family HTH domain
LVAERKPLAESIRELRRELGLTQVALAEKIGAAATSIQHYETGSRSPDCHTLARMAIAAYKASKLEAAEALARTCRVSMIFLSPDGGSKRWAATG